MVYVFVAPFLVLILRELRKVRSGGKGEIAWVSSYIKWVLYLVMLMVGVPVAVYELGGVEYAMMVSWLIFILQALVFVIGVLELSRVVWLIYRRPFVRRKSAQGESGEGSGYGGCDGRDGGREGGGQGLVGSGEEGSRRRDGGGKNGVN